MSKPVWPLFGFIHCWDFDNSDCNKYFTMIGDFCIMLTGHVFTSWIHSAMGGSPGLVCTAWLFTKLGWITMVPTTMSNRCLVSFIEVGLVCNAEGVNRTKQSPERYFLQNYSQLWFKSRVKVAKFYKDARFYHWNYCKEETRKQKQVPIAHWGNSTHNL